MKKFILSATMLFSVLGTSFAQTLVDGDETFNLNFANPSYCLVGCCNGTVADLYYASGGSLNRASSTFVGSSHKKFVATNPVVTEGPMWVDIYATIGAACREARGIAGIDMSTNKKVKITAKTASGTATVNFFLADFSLDLSQNGSSTYNINAGGGSVIKTFTATTTEQDFILDYSGDADFGTWAGRTGIDMYGIQVTAGDGVEIQVSSIVFGCTTCGTSNNSSANVVNDQVNLFPNPAKGSFNVDITAMNVESALVKVMNSNGIVVKEFNAVNTTEVSTEGLVKGIYMVQVTSGNKVANKKVVVE